MNKIILFAATIIILGGCQPQKPHPLKESLTFFASFDNGMEADFALGDKNMYTAPSRNELDKTQVGMNNALHRINENEGKFGHAFQFGRKCDTTIFYKSKANIAYSESNMTGTVSFWLRLDPAVDLEPGYTDPIQITDKRYDDAAIWVDFTNENPRDFRLGIFGDVDSWEKDTVQSSASEEFEKRLVRVKTPPFASDSWTHIVIAYSNVGDTESSYSLYMNGEPMGTVGGFDNSFIWNLETSNIYLGINFTGMMDELSIYNKPLTGEEIRNLYQLDGGVSSILR